MRKLIAFLLDGCWHKYVPQSRVQIFDPRHRDIPIGVKYVYQCSKCFKIKTRKDF